MVAQSPLERFPLFDVRGVFDIFRGREKPVVVELRNVSWPQDVGLRPLDDSWLRQFVAAKPSVAVQLVSRRISSKEPEKQAAVGDVYWRPFEFPYLKRKDLAESLVKYGRAVPEAAGLDSHPIIDGVNYEMNLDGSKEVEVLQNDVRRMRTLNDLEEEARKNQRGCWSGVHFEEEEQTHTIFSMLIKSIKSVFGRLRSK
ncbi:hypothetical protein TrVE_jg6236 [Triparma verrucosa]|uniref:Uncharacterized protein n=1 Tax=Triparma verrucosa TaxID=1606542 RepID=A0A9W7CAG3_9STRA|nr:hypothetical protein TrVE_jg6236 [Triparma verrucosa]